MDMEVMKVEIARLALRPEDTLVVRCTPPIDGETCSRIKRDLQQIVDHQKILVISNEIELSVLEPKRKPLTFQENVGHEHETADEIARAADGYMVSAAVGDMVDGLLSGASGVAGAIGDALGSAGEAVGDVLGSALDP